MAETVQQHEQAPRKAASPGPFKPAQSGAEALPAAPRPEPAPKPAQPVDFSGNGGNGATQPLK